MRLRKINKKGDATDIIFFGLIIFFLAISFVVGIYVNTKLADVVRNTKLNESAAASDILTGFDTINERVVQRGFVLMFAILIIGVLISGFLVSVHPIFIFIYIFTMMLAGLNAVYLSNLYQKLIENAQFAAIAANYPMITFIMQHAIQILIGVGALSLIVTFSKLNPQRSFASDI